MLWQQHEPPLKRSLPERPDLCLGECYSQPQQQLSWCHRRVLPEVLGTFVDKVLHFR
jgi:hypothetical protein